MTSPHDPADTLRRMEREAFIENATGREPRSSWANPLRQMPPTPWETEIVQVPPGTRIEYDGFVLAVTDKAAVALGRRIFVTPRHYEAIKMRASDV